MLATALWRCFEVTFHVSPRAPGSSDGQGCGADSSPCKTLNHAVSIAEDQDRILASAGPHLTAGSAIQLGTVRVSLEGRGNAVLDCEGRSQGFVESSAVGLRDQRSLVVPVPGVWCRCLEPDTWWLGFFLWRPLLGTAVPIQQQKCICGQAHML